MGFEVPKKHPREGQIWSRIATWTADIRADSHSESAEMFNQTILTSPKTENRVPNPQIHQERARSQHFTSLRILVFQNNLVAAKAALASCVLSLYFSRIGKGEWTHFGNGFQITILHSQAFGTGKTTCMNEWHKILGWFKQPIEGNSLTHAGLWGRLNQTSCMMLFIDDKKCKKSQEDDLAGLLRNVYDKTSNTKSGVYKVVGSPVTISVSSSPLSAPSALKTRPAFTMVELANSGRVLPPNLLVHCVLPHTLRTHNWIN